MSERKINLEEIILNVYGCKTMDELRNYMGEYGSVAMIKDCMKEACRQTLELAVENVVIEYDEGGATGFVDKESILDTINQIE